MTSLDPQLEILAFGAHPDDVEWACCGTLLKAVKAGHAVGIVDLTRGEMGSRGTPETRQEEAVKAAEILGLTVRENLGLRDGWFEIGGDTVRAVVAAIRRYRPRFILIPAPKDRHPDHARAHHLVKRAAFKAALRKIETQHPETDEPQDIWRPKRVLGYVQDTFIEPDVIVDVTSVFAQKMQAVKAYRSQFWHMDDGNTDSPAFCATENYLRLIEARARDYGHMIGTTFAEGFVLETPAGLDQLSDLV